MTAIAALLALPASSPAGETTSFQGNARHDGTVSEAIGPPLRSAWVRELGDTSMTALVAGGRVFTVRGVEPDVKVYALGGATGDTHWTAAAASLKTTIAYDAGTLFVSDRNGVLRALDAATGAQRWQVQLDYPGGTGGHVTAEDGMVYVVREHEHQGALHVLRASDGGTLWKATDFPFMGEATPAVGPDAVYVAYVSHHTAAFDRLTGASRWYVSGDGYGGGHGSAAVANGLVYRFDWAGEGEALDPATAAVKFAFPVDRLPPSIWGDALVVPHIYDVVGRDAATGAPRWQASVTDEDGLPERVSPVMLVNGIAYFGTEKGRLVGVDARTGQFVVDQRASVGQLFWIAAGNGRIVVSSGTAVEAFEAAATKPREPSSAPAPTPAPSSPPAPSTPGGHASPALRVPARVAWRTLRRRGLFVRVQGVRGLTVTVRATGRRCRIPARRTAGAVVRVRYPRRCARPAALRVNVRSGTWRASATIRVAR